MKFINSSVYNGVHTLTHEMPIASTTTSLPFELLNNASIAYNNAAIGATLQVTFDGGTTWEPVSTFVAGTAWRTANLPDTHKGFSNSGRIFRVLWASSFTGKLIVSSNNG